MTLDLNSTASFVAIVSVLAAWFQSARKALNVKRVVIHQNKEESTYILEIKNRKQYPVTIKNIRCFTREIYKTQKINDGNVVFSSIMSLSDSPFVTSENFQIESGGFTDIRIKAKNFSGKLDKLIFSMDTSHGYHQIKCKNILTVISGNTEVYGMEFTEEYSSKFEALYVFCKLRFKHISIQIIKNLKKS